LAAHGAERASNRIIRQSMEQLQTQEAGPEPVAVLYALQHLEAREPGSVVVRPSRERQTVILVGEDLLAEMSVKANRKIA
jgi:hypothetical protein